MELTITSKKGTVSKFEYISGESASITLTNPAGKTLNLKVNISNKFFDGKLPCTKEGLSFPFAFPEAEKIESFLSEAKDESKGRKKVTFSRIDDFREFESKNNCGQMWFEGNTVNAYVYAK